jgi:Adenylate and Guanylate cyclase catalytic domain
VVIANKMESGGASDKINVSEDSKNLLEQIPGLNFKYTFNATIECKAYERSVQSYFLMKQVDEPENLV